MSMEELTPGDAFQRAVGAYKAGRLGEAERLCNGILDGAADHFDAVRLLAVAQHRLGRRHDALASYDRLIALRPDDAEAHKDRGIVLQNLKRFQEALESYDKALAIRPDYAPAHHQRGIALHELLGFDEAVASFERALVIDPRDAEAHHRRCLALRELNRFEDALASCDAALAIRPDFVDAHVSRGSILVELRRFPEALANFGKAQELAPDNAEAHWHEAVLRLRTGDLIRGFTKYEWRSRRGKSAAPVFAKPQWDGLASVYDKTILLHGEKRLSDTIQFCRYAPLVAARGARIKLQVAEPLRRLMTSLGGVAQLLGDGEAVPDFDLHCPLNSLPFAFGTKLDTIPSATPYLRPPTEALLAWEMRLGAKTRPRVGIAWAGNPHHDNDRNRSLELRALTPLFDLGATLVRLQKDLPARDQRVFAGRNDIFDPTALLNDFSDTAALIARLDLVIAVDTSVAHLAGAMAKPVWILLSYTPDWRWLLGRNTSSWYPTARLYRQAAPDDWDEVVRRVAGELSAMLARDGVAAPARNVR
jgi:tetratricopeptide (TPR) repeat protein